MESFKELIKRMPDVHNLHLFADAYSKVDALLTSGSSDVIVEFKRRKSITDYQSALMEKQKLHSMKNLNKILRAKGLYIAEYDEVFLLWDVTKYFTNDPSYEFQFCRKNNSTQEKVKKEVLYLNFWDADFIYDKSFNRITNQKLLEITERKNNEDNDYMKTLLQ